MKVYGLVGKSLGHSFSKRFFTEKFASEGIDARYENFEIPEISDFSALIKSNSALNGLNVTIPYKEAVIPYLDELDEVAQNIGAVNTIRFEGERLIGYNTDAHGFHASIKPFLRNIHERALILGTGGAAKAVAHVLQGIGIDVCYLSRTPNETTTFAYEEANENMFKAFKLVVNCTPIGTFPNVEAYPPIPTSFFTPDHLLVDLIYNPEETQLMKLAKANGAETINGYAMLKHQALKAWEIWNK